MTDHTPQSTSKKDPRLAAIKAVVFDAYGTLFDVHSAARRLADRLGEKAQPLSDRWRQKQLEYTWLRSLMGVHADFWQVTGEALDYALAHVGITDPVLRNDLMALYLELEAYPEAPGVLQALGVAGHKRAILSNGTPSMLEAAVQSTGLSAQFDAVLSIEAVGIFKPSFKTYQLACDHFRCKPQEIAFLSSNAWDVAGGAAFGYCSIWVNRFNHTPERLPSGPIATLPNLNPLVELLQP